MNRRENLVLVAIICVGLILCSVFLFRGNIVNQFGAQNESMVKYAKNIQPVAMSVPPLDAKTGATPRVLAAPLDAKTGATPRVIAMAGNAPAPGDPGALDALTGATPRIISWVNTIIQKTRPAVVGICVGDTTQEAPWMQGWEIVTPSGLRSVGSGIVVNPEGYVLTNYHVVALGGNIKVSLFETPPAGTPGQQNYREYSAQIVAAEQDNDLALLKIISNRQFASAPIGDSDGVRVGDKVIGIGNPFGLTQTVTSGIVSAKRKKLPIGGIVLKNVLQLDVPINPGNSGGALVNTLGEIIGVNTAIYSPADSIYTGVSFAIPINQAVSLFKKYMDLAGTPANSRAVALQQPQQQNALGLGQNNYLAIQGNKVGPAQPPTVNAGAPPVLFVEGNRISPLPGQPSVPPVPPVNVLVNRIQPSPGEGIEEIAWLGIDLVPDNDANTTASEIEVDEIEGITPMEAGLQAGDILKKINGYPTPNMYALKEVLKKIPLETGQGIVLEVERERNGQYLYISFKLHPYDIKGR